MINVYPPKPEYYALACRLRENYTLTYFDSLRASVAVFEDLELVSYDKRYSEVRELKYIHPEGLAL